MHTMRNRVRETRLLLRLPSRYLRLLKHIGRLADERGVSVYLVGGVVRDLLLKCENWDLDLTVEGDGIAFARLVANRYRAGLAVYERFATARLTLPEGMKLDIATTRRESYAQSAALPDVEAASLKEDLYRRDFTINAMAIELNARHFGALHDPYGGQRDLKAKTIRVLHDKSFVDDPTRVFRAIRFAERFGFRLEVNTTRFLKEAAATDAIARLSGPRLCNEILLLAGESHPERSFAALARLQLLRFLHQDLSYARSTERTVRSLSKALRWWARYCHRHSIDRQLVYVMALLDRADQVVMKAVVARLMLSNEQAAKVLAGGNRLESVVRALSHARRMKRSAIYCCLNGLPDEALVLCLAKISGRAVALARIKQRILDYLTKLSNVKPVLRGDDLLRLGIKPGPAIGALLAALLEAKLDGVINTRRDEQAFVRRHLAKADEH